MPRMRQDPLTRRMAGIGTSIFADMTALAVRHGAVNLGQGFPDFDGPEFVREAAVAAIRAGHNQYARPWGLPELVRAVARHRERFYDLRFDAEDEVTVFAGATEALFATLQALFEPGDEAILFEPYYDSYRPALALAQARVKTVVLQPPRFEFDPSDLERAIGPNTRAIVLNTPHNPTGKVFTRGELEIVADICRRHDLLAITDEVYEHLTFGMEHVPLASLAGMRDRTVMISSAGKTFGLTGWKIGYACAAAPLTRAIRMVHQFVTYTNGTPFQHAVAAGLESSREYFDRFAEDYRHRRDRLCAGLHEAGFRVKVPEGTYFVVADIRPLGYEDDLSFCRELPARAGVAAIPVSAFCAPDTPIRNYVRFAFCKTDRTLDEGIRRLAAGLGADHA